MEHGLNKTSPSTPPNLLSPLSAPTFPANTDHWTHQLRREASSFCTPGSFLPRWLSLYQLWMMALPEAGCPALVPLKLGNPTVCFAVNPQAAGPGQSTTAKGIQTSLFCSLTLPLSPRPPKKGKINFNQRGM